MKCHITKSTAKRILHFIIYSHISVTMLMTVRPLPPYDQLKFLYETQFKSNPKGDKLIKALSATSPSMDTPGTTEDGRGPTANNLKQLSSQLDQWRNLLPLELKWPEDDPTAFPESTKVTSSYFQPVDPSLTTSSESQQRAPLFTIDLDQDPVQYPYVYDIQVAFLRTRFYYAKYIVNRPFVYKALHFPDQMTPGDMQGVETCLKVRPCHEAFSKIHSFYPKSV